MKGHGARGAGAGMSRRRRLALGLGLLTASGLLCVAVLEMVLRVGDLQGDQLFHPHPELGWVHRPSFSGIYVSPRATNRIHFDEDGFVYRAPERPTRTADRRLLVLGDSFTECAQVPYDASWPVLAASALETDGADWDVVNGGVSGYGTDQVLTLLREVGDAVDPDVVLVLLFTGNDLTDNDPELYARVGLGLPKPHLVAEGDGLRPIPGPPIATGPAVAVKNWFRDHSLAYLFVRDGLQRIRTLGRTDAGGDRVLPAHWIVYRVPTPPEVSRAAETTRRILVELRAEADRLGVPVGAMILPASFRVDPESRAHVLERHPGLDRDPAFAAHAPDSLLTYALDGAAVPARNLLAPLVAARAEVDSALYGDHLTLRGHRVVGREAAAFARELLTGHPPPE